jgi:hypothetical protein
VGHHPAGVFLGDGGGAGGAGGAFAPVSSDGRPLPSYRTVTEAMAAGEAGGRPPPTTRPG